MTEEFNHDVYISCATSDESWVERKLLPKLEKTGLRVYLEFRNHPVGVPKPIA
jgi:hypothetical protein